MLIKNDEWKLMICLGEYGLVIDNDYKEGLVVYSEWDSLNERALLFLLGLSIYTKGKAFS